MTASIHNLAKQNRYKVNFGHKDYLTLDKNIVNFQLPGINLGTTDAPTTNGRAIKIPGSNLDFSQLIMTHSLDETWTNYRTIIDWIAKLRDFRKIKIENFVFDITINFLDAKYKTVFTMQCEDCYPSALSEIDFDTQISTIRPVLFTTTFEVNGLTWS